VVLCAFFSSKAQRLLERGVRGKWPGGEFELGKPAPSKSTDDLPSGEAAPTPQNDAESAGLRTSIASPEELEAHAKDDESGLQTKMIIASLMRDQDALEDAYTALLSLPGRRQSDESLTTDKLALDHRMGDESAVAKLVRLAETNPDWYEPSQSLASIYYSLGSYDKASAHLKAAKNRARDDAERIRSLLLDARIREQTQGPQAANNFLKASLAGFPEQQYQAQIWKRVAELHWSGGEQIPSFIAAEISLQMQPLDKDLRFQLAYRYAESETTKGLAYYLYD
jgi:tetratricopeptide (TPR) repeat protein